MWEIINFLYFKFNLYHLKSIKFIFLNIFKKGFYKNEFFKFTNVYWPHGNGDDVVVFYPGYGYTLESNFIFLTK